MQNDKWPAEYERIRDELSELKEKEVVRAVGVSCHDFGALKVAAKHPWVDVIFARVNHKGGKEYSCDALGRGGRGRCSRPPAATARPWWA